MKSSTSSQQRCCVSMETSFCCTLQVTKRRSFVGCGGAGSVQPPLSCTSSTFWSTRAHNTTQMVEEPEPKSREQQLHLKRRLFSSLRRRWARGVTEVC